MFRKAFSITILVLTYNSWGSSVSEEHLYEAYQASIYHSKEARSLSILNPSLFVDALWDSLQEGPDGYNLKSLQELDPWAFPLAERLRVGILKIKFGEAKVLDPSLVAELEAALVAPDPDVKIIYIIAAHERLLAKSGHRVLIDLARAHDAFLDLEEGEDGTDLEADIISDLYFNTPDVTSYMGGEYLKSVKIFMFCQANRLYPCLMVMKDVNGQVVRNADGSLWINQALASAVTGLPSFERNGNTPAGIFTIDSVMPVADQQLSYGEFRRMILNFVPRGADEALMKSLLPLSSWESDWWRPSVVARDIGRNLFRIHGTGRKQNPPGTPYYPFSRTHGCVSQRENLYDGMQYQDQRKLLDKIMTSLELEAKFINEPKIKGILYLMDLNDRNAALTAEDLRSYGIY